VTECTFRRRCPCTRRSRELAVLSPRPTAGPERGRLVASAIIGMRYDANEIAAGVTEVLAYGTAVVIEPQR
jgi:uncharacterized protein YbjQ (UPF0145 family)